MPWIGDELLDVSIVTVALPTIALSLGASCGAAPSAELLVVARLIQGVAAGMLISQNSGLIQVLFHGAERGRAFGIVGATIGAVICFSVPS